MCGTFQRGPIRQDRVYRREMDPACLLEIARRHRGLKQAELAAKAGTLQAALSAYERGLKSPSLKVAY
ncbi:XRE family transcriptional regulator [Aeromicrobium sp. IC_218]|nr:XRE family transcriptional regulator [Aeromicrobium sp. IC_218]